MGLFWSGRAGLGVEALARASLFQGKNGEGGKSQRVQRWNYRRKERVDL